MQTRDKSCPPGHAGLTLAEILVGATLAVLVLGVLWRVVVGGGAGTAATGRRLEEALELTELLEMLSDDLFHARYVVPDETAGGGVLLVTKKLDEQGQPRVEVVRYETGSGAGTLERTVNEKRGGRRRKFQLPADSVGSSGGEPLGVNRAGGRLSVMAGERRFELSAGEPTFATPGTDVSAAAEQVETQAAGGRDPDAPVAPLSVETLDDAGDPSGSIESSAGTVGAARPGESRRTPQAAAARRELAAAATTADGAGVPGASGAALPTEPGDAVPMAPPGSLTDLAYEFLGGGDEVSQPAGAPDPSGGTWYQSPSNATQPGSSRPLYFYRRGNPLRRRMPGMPPPAASSDWVTVTPNFSSPGRPAADVNRPVESGGPRGPLAQPPATGAAGRTSSASPGARPIPTRTVAAPDGTTMAEPDVVVVDGFWPAEEAQAGVGWLPARPPRESGFLVPSRYPSGLPGLNEAKPLGINRPPTSGLSGPREPILSPAPGPEGTGPSGNPLTITPAPAAQPEPAGFVPVLEPGTGIGGPVEPSPR